MVSIRNIALAATTVIALTTAAPAEKATRQVPVYTPGTQNNTQEFYIHMVVTDGLATYNGWSLEAYHTGAGLADPVFVSGTGSPAFLNGTQLQFDVNAYPFSAVATPADTNYARWEPVTIDAGYGAGVWVDNGPAGIELDQEEFDGWIVCEWVHGYDAPQLFQMIQGFDSGPGYGPYNIPSSCARVLLFPQYF